MAPKEEQGPSSRALGALRDASEPPAGAPFIEALAYMHTVTLLLSSKVRYWRTSIEGKVALAPFGVSPHGSVFAYIAEGRVGLVVRSERERISRDQPTRAVLSIDVEILHKMFLHQEEHELSLLAFASWHSFHHVVVAHEFAASGLERLARTARSIHVTHRVHELTAAAELGFGFSFGTGRRCHHITLSSYQMAGTFSCMSSLQQTRTGTRPCLMKRTLY